MLRQTIRASVTRSCGVLPRARVALAQPTRQYHDDLIDHYVRPPPLTPPPERKRITGRTTR